MDYRKLDTGGVVFSLVFPTLVTWVYFVWLAASPAELQKAAYTLGKLIQFAFPLVWILMVQRRKLAWQAPGRSGLVAGLAFGAIIMASTLLLYFLWLKPGGGFQTAEAAVQSKIAGIGLNSLAGYVALSVFYSIGHSLLEEYYWRWFVFAELRRLISPGPAIAISSLGFMAHHVIVLAIYFGGTSPATAFFSLAVAVGGAAWAVLYYRYQSLYAIWASHLLVDAGIFIVGYDMLRDVFVA